MRSTYQITEYGSFIAEKQVDGYVTLPSSAFEQLENFILANRNKETDALEIMGLSAKKGLGKVITAKNYVGVLMLNDGTSIEILPKISRGTYSDGQIKKLVIEMLKTLKDSPYKSLQTTNVDIEKMGIFEVFIRMFIDEVFLIVKRGLKCSYEPVSSNENFFKGKVVFSEHIKQNYAHKERAFVAFDEFSNNRPENKLIKSTLLYLYNQTKLVRNKSDIKTLLNAFNEVAQSVNYASDFSLVVPGRNIKDYATALIWCRIFLMGKSFTSFTGSEVAFSLLFPMETLFESYIAIQLKKSLRGTGYAISVQDKTYHLFDEPKKFLMKPDIVIKHNELKKVFVMDTKWKALNDEKANYGISQADMYQMYAYQKKYHCENVTLLYPLTENVEQNKGIDFRANDGTLIKVRFVDLFNINDSLSEIIAEINTVY